MIIRFANENDDKKTMAKLLYETDRFIYPYWFDSKEEGIEVLARLMEIPNCLFYFKNTIVAIEDDKIVAILTFFTDKTDLSYDYQEFIDFKFEYAHVIKNFVFGVMNEVRNNESYVFGLRVDENYTRRHIAQSMFEFLFKQFSKGHVMHLDVLVDNLPAVALYKKVGFEIIRNYNGYNGYKKRKPPCFEMIKKFN